MDTAPSPLAPPAAGPLLDHRPVLRGGRSAVRRAPDAVQFGTDPGRALVLDGLTPPLHRMITALDGTRCAREVIADAVAHGVSPAPARAALGQLAAAGLLDGPTGPSGSVMIRGRGRLAVALAGVLAGAGLEVGLVAAGVVGADDTGTGLTAADIGRPVGEAVTRAMPDVRAGSCPRPDLVVLTGAAVDPALGDELVRRGRAHLAATVRDGVGRVGPLVRPGRGACLRCVELARTDHDPAWPTVLAQLVGSPPVVGVADATATAAVTAAAVLASLGAPGSGTPAQRLAPGPATAGGVVELDLARGTLTRAPVAVHPACLCAAAPPRSGRRPPAASRPARRDDVARVA